MNFLQGRINRATYWLCVALIGVIYTIISLIMGKQQSVSEAVLVFVAVPRLHDIGRSGWLVLLPIILEVIALVLALAVFPQIDLIVMGAAALIIFGLVVWLGLVPGQPRSNQFGEPPKPGLKLSAPAKKST